MLIAILTVARTESLTRLARDRARVTEERVRRLPGEKFALENTWKGRKIPWGCIALQHTSPTKPAVGKNPDEWSLVAG